MPWLLAAVFALLGEGVFMMLGRDELLKGTEDEVSPVSKPAAKTKSTADPELESE